MISILVLEIISLVLLIVAIVFLLKQFVDIGRLNRFLGKLRKSKAKRDPQQRMPQMEALLDSALRALNCETFWSDDQSDRVVSYQYQNGHFKIRVEQGSPFARMLYLFCFSASLDDINYVRIACNHCNVNSENERVVYIINEQKNEVDLHILAGLMFNENNVKEALTVNMRKIFAMQNFFMRKYSDIKGEGKGGPNEDRETDAAEFRRQLYLIRQQEMQRQEVGPLRVNDHSTMPLAELMDKTMGLDNINPSKLVRYGNPPSELYEKSEILNFDLKSLMRIDNCPPSEAVFRQDPVLLSLSFETPRHPGLEYEMMINMRHEGFDGHSQYYRLTMCLMPAPVSEKMTFTQRRNEQSMNSVLVAYDLTSSQQQIDEFNYMWAEAKSKLRKGEELSDEQTLICECLDTSMAQLLYRGKKLFLAERYYEALVNLESAYDKMQRQFDTMSHREKENFYEVCYMAGFCYCELGQYKRAYSYLDSILGLQRIVYTEELVNCMVNSGDYRAYRFVDNLISQISQTLDLEEGEIPPEHLARFLSFLNRRKTYLLIEKQRYEEAKEILNKMLDDPDNSDFALNELAYIQRLEKESV